MAQIIKNTIVEQIKELGVKKGDTIFVAADLMRVGYFNKTIEQTLSDWVSILTEVVGENGTITVPTYSPVFLRFFKKYDFVFTKDTKSNSGSLANAILEYGENVQRGMHPSNSCASIGKNAQIISEVDGPEFPKYNPYRKIVELGGKNLLLGIVDLRNSPFTYHHVQELLGQTRSHPFSGLFETKYINKDGQLEKFIVRELGGCTRGVHKAWGYHLASNAVKFGQVGRSTSAYVDAQKSTEILKKVMIQSPGLLTCDDQNCISCHGRPCYNGYKAYWFYLRRSPYLAKKILDKVLKK